MAARESDIGRNSTSAIGHRGQHRSAPATYTGFIRVAPDSNASGARTVPVTLVVQPPTSLTVSQPQLVFNSPGSQTLTVSATGAPIPFTVTTSGGAWLTANPPAGTTPTDVTVSVSTAGLQPATYQGLVIVTPSGSNQGISIPVTFNLTQGQPTLNAITNGASFAPGAIAPGEIITLFGTNIGPSTLTSAAYDSSGTLQSTVADVQVLFDNIPAPLIYVQQGQVAAIVPFGLFGRTTTRVQLINGPTHRTYWTSRSPTRLRESSCWILRVRARLSIRTAVSTHD